jgi:hypothetical protein
MNRNVAALVAALWLAVGVLVSATLVSSRAEAASSQPCSAPNQVGSSSIEEIAWQLWVAATCPVNQDQYPFVVWENWIEQDQLYPLDPSQGLKVPNSGAQAATPSHLLHASALALAKNPSLVTLVPGLLGGADQNCAKANIPPPNQPNLVICEEVRENGAFEDYLAGNNLWNRAGQQQAALSRDTIQFPPPAIEIKADWIQLSTIGLSCDNLPLGFTDSIHVEIINGNCFALAGIHLISKLIDQWIWATFEPQNLTTNPNRCKVLGCTDPFGSRPVSTHGAFTKLSATLANLMTAANLSTEWKNYRLDEVQTDFLVPMLAGNSIIEAEAAGVPLTQSSCITCHAVSSIKNDGTDGITLLNSNPVGLPQPLPSNAWIRRDFIWSMFLACPGGAQACAQQ